jgi:hypothetical protein
VSIVNRRNAVLGWATWKLGKRMVGRPNKKSAGVGAVVLAGAASAAGALTFWRKRQGGESSS